MVDQLLGTASSAQGESEPFAGADVGRPHPALDDYPELDLVLSIAVSAVVPAFGIDASDRTVVEDLEEAAIAAMVDAYAPKAATARLMARTAEDVRRARAAEAQTAAQAAEEAAAALAALDVPDAAAITAAERAHAARIVARSVSVAVSEAAAADAAALAAELEVLNAALTVEAIAFDTCYRLAVDAAAAAAAAGQAPGGRSEG
jgi:hypothetical protein